MQTLEWTTVDKSSWGYGPWATECDKKQWQDLVTGLPCLAVRNHGGNWCGYVGVPTEHPWHGLSYSDCSLATARPRGRKEGDEEILPGHKTPESMVERMAKQKVCEEDSYCDHRPESVIDVHGGLTFADACTPLTRETWERWRSRIKARAEEAIQHPQGDIARELRDRVIELESFEAWQKHGRATFICHLPEPGEPDDVHWFGFDCGHCDDMSPGYALFSRTFIEGRTYRTLAYLEDQVASLARQLTAITRYSTLIADDMTATRRRAIND